MQNEFSPRFRSSRDELKHCGERGIAFLPWSPLGGSGARSKQVGQLYRAFNDIGAERDVSPQQVVIAWQLGLGGHVIPIPGASQPASITDSMHAMDLHLSEDEVARIEAQFS